MSRPLLSTSQVDQRGVVVLVAAILLPFLCTYLAREHTGVVSYKVRPFVYNFNDYTQYFECNQSMKIII